MVSQEGLKDKPCLPLAVPQDLARDSLEVVELHRETCPNDHLTPASKDRSSIHPSDCSVTTYGSYN